MVKHNLGIDGITIGHVQGIATDKIRQFMYYSCTTYLAKTDMEGNIIGTVKGLTGHLGCIAYNYEDGKVYGSLEYKHDVIGAGILRGVNRENGSNITVSNGFYVAILDVDKIDRMDMDGETDGIVTTVFLKEVFDDYTAPGHRFGCSGIDGITFAPVPGPPDGKKHLYVAYGIYGDTEREDNDHQIILRYDISDWGQYKRPLNQSNLHRSGPEKADSKYFIYTGNTTFGVQNLEYDDHTGYLFAAVYKGEKEHFPNYPMYVIDLKKEPSYAQIKGTDIRGETLSLADIGQKDTKTGIRGIDFPYGATGMIALGNGDFYFSQPYYADKGAGTIVGSYRLDTEKGFIEK